MTYKDKTWCAANCKADGSCGRKLTPWDNAIIRLNKIPVSFADFSNQCELYDPDPEGENDAFQELLQGTYSGTY